MDCEPNRTDDGADAACTVYTAEIREGWGVLRGRLIDYATFGLDWLIGFFPSGMTDPRYRVVLRTVDDPSGVGVAEARTPGGAMRKLATVQSLLGEMSIAQARSHFGLDD